MIKEVYFISGLGADERAFARINTSAYHTHFIQWIRPLPAESLAAYVQRLRQQISSPRPILVGMSFGGIVAIELAKIMETERVIIISSIKQSSEKPALLHLGRLSKLYRLFPDRLFNTPHPFLFYVFGIQRQKNVRQLLSDIIRDADPVYVRWAIDQIVHWENTDIPAGLVHIHGTTDKLFPPARIEAQHWIEGGSHFMIWIKAAEISRLLNQYILGTEAQAAGRG